jgi:hypothetical protein
MLRALARRAANALTRIADEVEAIDCTEHAAVMEAINVYWGALVAAHEALRASGGAAEVRVMEDEPRW